MRDPSLKSTFGWILAFKVHQFENTSDKYIGIIFRLPTRRNKTKGSESNYPNQQRGGLLLSNICALTDSDNRKFQKRKTSGTTSLQLQIRGYKVTYDNPYTITPPSM